MNFTLTSSSYCLRSHPLQIKPIKDFKCPQWPNSFFGRIPSLWNVLPSLLVTSSSLNSFKINLKDHLLGHQFQNKSWIISITILLDIIFIYFIFSYYFQVFGMVSCYFCMFVLSSFYSSSISFFLCFIVFICLYVSA